MKITPMAPSAIQYTHPPVSFSGVTVGLIDTWASALCGRTVTTAKAPAIATVTVLSAPRRERMRVMTPAPGAP